MTMYDDSRVVTLLREIDPPVGPPDRLTEVRRRARRHESRRATVLAAVMAVVLAAGVVSAVNLGDRGGDEVLTVADAAKATQAAGTARISLRMTITDRPANSLIPVGQNDMKLAGLIDFAHGRYVLTGTSLGQVTETRVIGRDRWTKVPTHIGFGDVGGKPWFHSVTKGGGPDSFLSDTDPSQILKELQGKGEVVSTTEVDGRTRTVLRIPSDAFGGSASSTKVSDAQVVTETDAEGRIRLVSSTVKEPSLGTLTIEIRFDDFGVKVDVRPPPADQVQESASSSSGSEFSVTTSGSGSSSAADRKKACEQMKAVQAQLPPAKTEQEKAQRRQFADILAKVCAKS